MSSEYLTIPENDADFCLRNNRIQKKKPPKHNNNKTTTKHFM